MVLIITSSAHYLMNVPVLRGPLPTPPLQNAVVPVLCVTPSPSSPQNVESRSGSDPQLSEGVHGAVGSEAGHSSAVDL